MKTIILISSIFFLLGLKISNLIDLRGKANAVENIITNKIRQSKPVQAIPLFNEQESGTNSQADSLKTAPEKQLEAEKSTD